MGKQVQCHRMIERLRAARWGCWGKGKRGGAVYLLQGWTFARRASSFVHIASRALSSTVQTRASNVVLPPRAAQYLNQKILSFFLIVL